ncbi:MAG: D-aminoacyl-tRNA deacylase [Promethearchaeota archaeon]
MSAICLCSLQDIAAQNIKQQLLSLFPFIETEATFDSHPIYKLDNLSIVTIQSDSINADQLDEQLSADIFIFASRHKSAAFKPALLTHIPGNWADAQLGGKSSQLCIAPPSALRTALHTLLEEQERLGLKDWACGLEATHHGPWIENTPVLFIEIGSTEREWRNKMAAEIVARSIVAVAQNMDKKYPIVLGFGGPHYCPAFTRLCTETGYAVSHIMPKYHISQVSEVLVQHAINRTKGEISCAAIDWKGMKGSQREHLFDILNTVGLGARRVRDLLHSEKCD